MAGWLADAIENASSICSSKTAHTDRTRAREKDRERKRVNDDSINRIPITSPKGIYMHQQHATQCVLDICNASAAAEHYATLLHCAR